MRLRILSTFRRSGSFRLVTRLAMAGQLLMATPVLAQDLTQATVRASAQLARDTGSLAGAAAQTAAKKSRRALADAKRKLAKASVKVNRTVPAVTPPSFHTSFGVNVSAEAITRTAVFGEPLLPTSTPSAEDNRALAALLTSLAGGDMPHRFRRMEQFLEAHPASPWRASLLANAATLFARGGYFSRAAAYWEQAWELTRDSADRHAHAIADYSLGESLSQMVTFGQVERLEQRLKAIASRDVRGSAGAKVTSAAAGLMYLRDHHDLSLFSGPEALKALLRVTTDVPETQIRRINEYHPAPAGTTIAELKQLAASIGRPMRIVRSAPLAEIPVPSIVHFRSQHFSAVTANEHSEYLLRDPALGGGFRMSEAALRDEASGYVLVDQAMALPADWREVADGEAASVIGHCAPGGPSGKSPPCPKCGEPPPGDNGGMPQSGFHPVTAALIVDDVPVGYTPAIGPAVVLALSYNHRDDRQPQTPNYGNVGPLWSFNSLSYVTDNPYCILSPCITATVYLRGHGQEGYGMTTVHGLSQATLTKVANDPPRYERELPDGTVEVFAQPDRPASEYNRRILLTEVIDPQGNALTYTYDSSLRLVGITDALGQVTVLAYENASDPLLLTKVTDPFGRFAVIAYDAAGRIQSITDAANMTSSFAYSAGDFITSMTTPYGTTTFRHEAQPGWDAPSIEATDPLGGTERLEFNMQNNALASTEPSNLVPTGFTSSNVDLHKYNSLFWDKLTMARYPKDLSKAVVTSWMFFHDPSEHHPLSHPVPHSVKKPLENRIWYRYPGQSGRSLAGTGRRPALTGRVLDDGSSQITQMTYNSKGVVTSRIDPVGRQTNYTYANNGIDLLTVDQVRSGGTDVIQAYADHTDHLPRTITDAAGQDTELTYNTVGQILTVTNAKDETTTYTYDTETHQLLTVTGPVSGATTTYTYDGYGRVESVEDADGDIVVTDYDHLNRITQRTYPDDTTETLTYARLDLVAQTDRLGRVTRHFYDGFGRKIATRDPAGRTVSQVWCDCGAMDALIDGNGSRTTWERDVQGRVTREIRADNTTDMHYTYDFAGRLKTITDPNDQVTTHSYNLDDSLSGTAYTDAEIETPNVSYTYDTYYKRVATMVDGIGTTSYTYKAPGTNGAGQVATIDGPLTNDTIAYTYDELGRVIQRTINGSTNQVDWSFDALGRVTAEENLLGEFAYTYDTVTNRLATVTYPNGQTSAYTYLDDENDHRLQTIHHKYPDTSTLSKFDYTYDAVGNIVTWRQQADSTAVMWKYGYDPADQLIAAVKHATDAQETVLKRYAYAYDPAGNRTVEQVDDAVTLSAYNNLNRLTSQAPGGPMVVAGSLNEPGTVTISGVPVTVDANNNFRGTVPTTTGTNTFTIAAKDANGNTTTKQYEIEMAGSSKTFTYDANGNLTSDGSRSFEWDGRNQLVAVTIGTYRSEFSYDGRQRRVRVIEKENSIVQSDTKVIWCRSEICEERAADGTTVTRRAFTHGDQMGGNLRLFAADHLGSVTEVVDSSATLLGRYTYDPWGRRSVTAGTDVTSGGFTGHRWHASGSILLTQFRGYDTELGRWLSEDPLDDIDGPNHYAYVRNQPITRIDPDGRFAVAVAVLPTVIITVGLVLIVMNFMSDPDGPSECRENECNKCYASCLEKYVFGQMQIGKQPRSARMPTRHA